MTIRDRVRPMPGVRHFSLLRQRLRFTGSASYWERNYTLGGTSGDGSYGDLAAAKAEFLNAFVRENDLQSVTEFGCGDGNQLSLADYPRYVGLDVSPTALMMCKRRFAHDSTKSFFIYDGTCFVDRAGIFAADLAISIDVIYHLIEDPIYQMYMTHLFATGQRYVVVYATNAQISGTPSHVRHRHFSSWVGDHCPDWRLEQVTRGPNPGPGRADFFTYKRLVHEYR